MVQMSAQNLLSKTEKAQISGQMQIICTGWQLWLAANSQKPILTHSIVKSIRVEYRLTSNNKERLS